MLLNVKHKNVIEVYEGFWENNRFFIFMELAEHGSLRSKIGSPLSERAILNFLSQILEGLDYIHKQKVIHRDLKTRKHSP